MHPVLSVKNLTKIYPTKKPFTAVDGISFDLKEGEILGLLGPNGSGKTTTIQMLLGTLATTSGKISYFDLDFNTHRSQILQSVSFASTYANLPYTLTVEENLEVFGHLYGLKRRHFRKRAEELMERFGILDKKKGLVSSLSAGQITRLMLVKAFFIDPKIVLLDEPTASLDPDISRDVCEFLLEQREKRGLSILFTSHKMEEVAQLCDRTIFLKNGKVIADDLPANLAHSISSCRLHLKIDRPETIASLALAKNYPYQIGEKNIQITLNEKEIPLFLKAIALAGLDYVGIQIEEPSLEDYFLHISEKKS